MIVSCCKKNPSGETNPKQSQPVHYTSGKRTTSRHIVRLALQKAVGLQVQVAFLPYKRQIKKYNSTVFLILQKRTTSRDVVGLQTVYCKKILFHSKFNFQSYFQKQCAVQRHSAHDIARYRAHPIAAKKQSLQLFTSR